MDGVPNTFKEKLLKYSKKKSEAKTTVQLILRPHHPHFLLVFFCDEALLARCEWELLDYCHPHYPNYHHRPRPHLT